MLEGELGLSHQRRHGSALGDVERRQRLQSRLDVGDAVEGRDGARPERAAKDRRPQRQVPLAVRQAIEPRPDHRGQAGRRGQPLEGRRAGEQALVGEHVNRLLQVQRVAVGSRDDRFQRRLLREAAEELAHERPAVVRGQGRKLDHEVGIERRRARPGRGEHEQRESPVEEEPDELEQAGLGPVEVLEDDDERVARHELERPADAPLEFAARDRLLGA